MPQISAFYGIHIYMYFSDHDPPHFHANYAGRRGRFYLDGRPMGGSLPTRARKLVREWAAQHQEELADCWTQVCSHELPDTIEPLA